MAAYVLALSLTMAPQAHGWSLVDFNSPWVDPLNTRPPVLDLGAARLPGDELALPCSSNVYSEQAFVAPLTLAVVADLALCNNPQIQSSWAAIKVQAAALGEAKAAYLPIVTLGLSQMNDQTSYPGSGINSSAVDNATTNAAFNWRIFDFGGRAATEAAANATLQAALASHDATLQKSLGAVISAYFDAQSTRAALTARQSQENLARLTLEAARRKESRGAGAQTDTLQAATAFAKATLERNRATGALNKALAVLVYSMGLPAMAPIRLAEEVSLPSTELQEDLHQWLLQVQMQHPAIRAARYQWDVAQKKLQSAQSEGLPTADLSVNFYENGRPNQSLSPTKTQETLASVSLNFPVFTGFGNTYKVRGAQAQVEQAQAQLQNVEHQTLSDVVSAHADASAALDNLAASDALLQAAKAAVDTLQRKFDRGAADILELLSTQSALADAQLERVRSIAEWRSARLRLFSASGVLGRTAYWQ